MDIKDIVIHKKELVETIYVNTQKQVECITNEQIEEFENLIYDRNELIENLKIVNKELLNVELSDDLKEIDNNIKVTIKAICDIDHTNQAILKNMQKDIDNEFKKMNTAKKVITKGYMNYAGVEQQPACFLDKKN